MLCRASPLQRRVHSGSAGPVEARSSSHLLALLSAIREFDAKLLVNYWLPRSPAVHPSMEMSSSFAAPAPKVAQVSWDAASNTITAESSMPSWVHNTKLVAKPDQLIKRRGKAGLLKLNCDWADAQEWIQARAGKPQKVSCAAPRARAQMADALLSRSRL